MPQNQPSFLITTLTNCAEWSQKKESFLFFPPHMRMCIRHATRATSGGTCREYLLKRFWILFYFYFYLLFYESHESRKQKTENRKIFPPNTLNFLNHVASLRFRPDQFHGYPHWLEPAYEVKKEWMKFGERESTGMYVWCMGGPPGGFAFRLLPYLVLWVVPSFPSTSPTGSGRGLITLFAISSKRLTMMMRDFSAEGGGGTGGFFGLGVLGRTENLFAEPWNGDITMKRNIRCLLIRSNMLQVDGQRYVCKYVYSVTYIHRVCMYVSYLNVTDLHCIYFSTENKHILLTTLLQICIQKEAGLYVATRAYISILLRSR